MRHLCWRADTRFELFPAMGWPRQDGHRDSRRVQGVGLLRRQEHSPARLSEGIQLPSYIRLCCSMRRLVHEIALSAQDCSWRESAIELWPHRICPAESNGGLRGRLFAARLRTIAFEIRRLTSRAG